MLEQRQQAILLPTEVRLIWGFHCIIRCLQRVKIDVSSMMMTLMMMMIIIIMMIMMMIVMMMIWLVYLSLVLHFVANYQSDTRITLTISALWSYVKYNKT